MKAMINAFKIMVLTTVSIALLTGCSATQKSTQSPRTAIEQLLISEAVIRSLPRQPESPLPIPPGSSVVLNTSGLTPDQTILQPILAGWLGQHGYLIPKDEKNAAYRIDVIIGALGTELEGIFFGMPPIQSVLIPFSLPELSLFKSQSQTGYIKFHMNIFEIPAGRFAGSTSNFLADSYYNNYTVLFAISFTSTDLVSVPQLGAFRRKPLNSRDKQGEGMAKPETEK
ncbi:MAG: hypothetical protein ABIV42_00985 [Nitrosospira sp.]